MKKNLIIAAALGVGIAFSSCEEREEHLNVATFEDVSLGVDSINSHSTDAVFQWISGDFGFTTGIAYNGSYYYNYVVSGQQSNQYATYADQYHSAPGGAVAGKNFVVGYQDNFSEGASLSIRYTGTLNYIPGTYVTNTAYVANSIQNGDGYAKAFTDGDYFLLTFEGYLAGIKISHVDFYLADYRNGKSLIVKDWTYVSLKELGVVDEIRCTLTSTDNGEYGMNTPAYFCLDNLGAKK